MLSDGVKWYMCHESAAGSPSDMEPRQIAALLKSNQQFESNESNSPIKKA